MKKYILGIAMLPLLASCVEDKNTYDYRTINEVSVNKMDSVYKVLAHIDHLQISPTVEGTLYGDNLDNYTYKWHVCTGALADNAHQHTVISHDKDLDWQVDLDPGDYTVYFTVREKDTGIESSVSTHLAVSGSFGKGFLLLGDVDGTERLGLDMLTMAPNRDTIMVEEAFDNSRLNLSHAKKLYYSGNYFDEPARALYMMTEDDSYLLTSGANDRLFEAVCTFDERGIFDCEYNISKPLHLVDAFPHGGNFTSPNLSRNARIYVTDDVVFGGARGYEGGEYYAAPFNRYYEGGPLFRFYPVIFYSPNRMSMYTPVCFMYDLDNECFVRFAAQSGTAATPYSTEALTISGTWPFNFKLAGYKFICGVTGHDEIGFTNIIAIDNHGDYVVLRMLVPDTAAANCTNKEEYVIDRSIATDFDKASIYAFSDSRTSVLYAVGNTLYHYDYSRKIIDKKTFDSEIVYLKPEFQSKKVLGEIIVATWDDTAKGMVYKFSLDTNPGSAAIIDRDNESWHTRLRIKDISWFIN